MSILRKKVIWVCVGLLVIWIIATTLMPSDKALITKLVEKGRKACETKNADAILGVMSMDYRDNNGMTYIVARKILENVFTKYDDIKITVRGLKVEVDDDEKGATATFSARAEATVLRTKGNPENFPVREVESVDGVKLHLTKMPTGWRVISMEGVNPESY